ncbi:hypothetical protein ACAN107058_00995 [Paracidovorax anthurii]|uniref:Uncharacterized protein n=2 Tax=Paracidovorax anthurii TaxID=78229 RepID=A0A328ZJF4_9BURK|nr:hypothetical protein AX018_101084 [Paracidovorax anthurii]
MARKGRRFARPHTMSAMTRPIQSGPIHGLPPAPSPATAAEGAPASRPRSQAHARSGLMDALACIRTEPRDAGDASAPQSPRPRQGILACLPRLWTQAQDPAPESRPLSMAQQVRHDMQREALDQLSAAPAQAVLPIHTLAQPASLEAIAQGAGVPAQALETHLRSAMQGLCDRVAHGHWKYSNREDAALTDLLFHLHALGQAPSPPAWLGPLRHFDTFVAHFCPQANMETRAHMIKLVKFFERDHRPEMLLEKRLHQTGVPKPIYNGPGDWVELPKAWVDRQVVEEARQLLRDGNFPREGELLVHGTGSAALGPIAKEGAICSAAKALRKGRKVVTGEYVSYIQSNSQASSTGGTVGLGDVYASKHSLGSGHYAMPRWFDETGVAFGISEAKQRAYNQARRIRRDYDNTEEGIVIGPAAPLKNVVALSAPKASEARVRAWIEAHCPHAKFVSYEAAELLDDDGMFGLIPTKRALDQQYD